MPLCLCVDKKGFNARPRDPQGSVQFKEKILVTHPLWTVVLYIDYHSKMKHRKKNKNKRIIIIRRKVIVSYREISSILPLWIIALYRDELNIVKKMC